ncbi:hypothetical protein BH11PSE13_BH11PSE13_12130 [soil metagenome]
MADILLDVGGKNYKRVTYAQAYLSGLVLSLNLSAVASAAAKCSAASAAASPMSGTLDQLHLKTNVANAFTLSGASFKAGGKQYVVKANGDVQVDPSPVTGNGTTVGTMTGGLGEVVLNSWAGGSTPAVSEWRGLAAAPVNGVDTPYATYGVTFRTSTAPLRPSGLSILGTMQDGTTFNVSADADGIINATRVKGRVNYQTGVVQIIGVTPSAPAGQSTSDLSFLGITGVTNVYIDLFRQETLRYNAVAYTYLPLDPELLGIDPVRLPTDGRVPIFKPAGFVVVGRDEVTTPATAVVSGVVNTGKVRLSRVRVIGHDNVTIETGYTVDREAGTVTWTNVTGYSQPVRVEYRVEDMAQIRDAQINGEITVLRALTHEYPADGKTFVSSAFMAGDLRARMSLLFDLASWNKTDYSDTPGPAASFTYNDISHPFVMTNSGTITERWGIYFASNMAFQIYGEHLGLIGTGSINTDTAPVNPDTGEPYFFIPLAGWGTGQAVGNALRFNTVGAVVPFWEARTIKQSAEAGLDYSFTTLARGNIDNPT